MRGAPALVTTEVDTEAGTGLGERLHALVAELYPICRSITGDGVRETLARIGHVPIKVHEVPDGYAGVGLGTIPRQWNIKDAYIKDPAENGSGLGHRNTAMSMGTRQPIPTNT